VAESRVDKERVDGLRQLHTLRAKLEAGLPPKQNAVAIIHLADGIPGLSASLVHVPTEEEETAPDDL
jgi:hypothetical protein